MSKKEGPPEERYLKIPFHILNHPGLSDGERWLLAWLYSFGPKGCYQNNAQLAEALSTNQRSITRRIAKLDELGLLYMSSPRSTYRCIWITIHPEVQVAATALGNAQHRQNRRSNIDKSVHVDRQKRRSNIDEKCSQHGQKCPTTIINYNSTKKTTTASPSPSKRLSKAMQRHKNRERTKTKSEICSLEERRKIVREIGKKYPNFKPAAAS